MPESRPPLQVSVALCTHNGLPFVVQQVNSILSQSVLPMELVLSDDASTDATVSVVRDLVARARTQRSGRPFHLRVLENATALGITANFEQAIRECAGDIVVLSDQDDVWHEHRVARLTEEFASNARLLLVHSDARLVDENGDPLGELLSEGIGFTAAEQRAVSKGRALDVLLRRNVVTGATAAFRRELVDQAVPFPSSWVHDEWLAMVAALHGEVAFIPEVLVDYRQHGANQIGAGSPDLREKVGRLTEPRAERNARLLARAEALAERFPESRAGERKAALLRGKVGHERARSALPRSRVRRAWPVLREWAGGGYRRFGRARYDVPRDLLQPAGE